MKTLVAILALLLGQDAPPDVRAAMRTLEASADDPKASLVVGKWKASQGAWEEALPFLIKGADGDLRKALDLESSEPKVAPGEIADSWMRVSQKADARFKAASRARAFHWYGVEWASAPAEARGKLRQKLHKISGFQPALEAQRKMGPKPMKWVGFDQSASSYLDPVFSVDGRVSIKLLPTGKEAESWYACAMTEQAAPPPAGTKLTLSAFVFTSMTDKDGQVAVRFYGADGKLLEQSGPPISPDVPVWTRVSSKYIVPVGANRFDIFILAKSAVGATWVDAVSLTTADGVDVIQNGSVER